MCRMLLALLGLAFVSVAQAGPNVLLVITDDQGYGDLGLHGNPVVRTPTLDKFGRTSQRLANFYVSPVCSPTRSSLLTGLYNYRTGIVDTFIGRSLMRPGEFPTLPELLSKNGYTTGLFGKWHLGDNYPLRPEDRGFQHTLWHRGGGLSQPSDPPGGSKYFDPVLVKNGRETPTKGYCTDIFTDEAINFIKQANGKPFFTYIAYNCPHGPYEVADELVAPYRKLDLTPTAFPQKGQPWAGKKLNTEEIARAYAMIENVDTNFARLLKTLDELKIADDTLVIFLTDNGPGGVRFNSGLRNRKGTVYEGGIKVPCFVRWPKRWKEPGTVSQHAAHIDLTPTILDACQVKATGFDGRSLLPILDNHNAAWAPRTLYFQWHRGDEPEKFRCFAAREERYKLVQSNGAGEKAKWKPTFELFDLEHDPFEQNDIAGMNAELVEKMKKDYSKWFAEVTVKGFAPPPIILCSAAEPVSRLSRQDWRGPESGWTANSRGHFEVKFTETGRYQITVIHNKPVTEFRLRVGQRQEQETVETPRKSHTFTLKQEAAITQIQADVKVNNNWIGADYIEVKR